jgi:molybdenum cofactor biosynthesis enzyme MoaA
LKPKLFHEKCKGCKSKLYCGEGEYLRLSSKGTLDPCMYAEDLKILINKEDTEQVITKKMALGLRRIHKDDK